MRETKLTFTKAEEPVPAEVMETEVLELAKAFKKLSSTRLKREAIITLLADTSKVAKGTIRIILNCLDQLEHLYLNPKV